ncbi:MAG: hypothetical protein IJL63_10110 [Clostridia bacterium]|nr:hypothetical protein [Clostridia bacterium]
MDVRCEVCGCRTEENQLGEVLLAGRKTMACPVCKKSLGSIAKNPRQHLSEAQNLLNMDTGTRRSAEVQSALTSFFGTLGLLGEPAEAADPAAHEAELEALRHDLDELKSRFDRFYRRYVISKILAIALPVLLVVIMLIILLASGAVGNIIDYYNTIVEYSNM